MSALELAPQWVHPNDGHLPAIEPRFGFPAGLERIAAKVGSLTPGSLVLTCCICDELVVEVGADNWHHLPWWALPELDNDDPFDLTPAELEEVAELVGERWTGAA